jgi:hypothetical protein
MFGVDVQGVSHMVWGCCMGHLKSWRSWQLAVEVLMWEDG